MINLLDTPYRLRDIVYVFGNVFSEIISTIPNEQAVNPLAWSFLQSTR